MALVLTGAQQQATKTQDTGGAVPYFNIVQAKAQQYGVPFWLLEGVYGIETSFGAHITTSSAGAMGAFQFIPATAARYGYPMTNTVDRATFTAQADAAARYLRDLTNQHHGNLDAALRAYSGGGYGEAQVRATAGKQLTSGEDAAGNAPSFTQGAANDVTGAVSSAGDALTAIVNVLKLVFSIRGLQVLAGLGLMVIALRTLAAHLTGQTPSSHRTLRRVAMAAA